MKRNKLFFKKLFAFIALVIILNAGFNAVYDRWMYYFRLARNQDEQFASCPDTLKYLMLGNSHNRINPEVMGNGFCYITPKEVYKQSYYKLRYILENTSIRPANILLSIDPVNFSPKAENDLSFDGYWRKYLDYAELAREHNDPGYFVNWAAGNFFSYVGNYKYVYMSMQFFNYDFKQIRYGYFPPRNYKNFAREPNRDLRGYEIASAYLASYAKRSVLGETTYYCKILDLCRQNSIRLILLRMPMTDEYLKAANRLVDLDKLDHDILELTRQHNVNFRLFDFRNQFSGQPSYFFNADHVNPAGAAIVSKKIKDELEKNNDAEIAGDQKNLQ